ncbi:hypothetical protein QMA04_17875 [Planococcus sp. APC 3900]|uniref:hypothetical protein n=1 Tax=Planococcus sp. APC 3900 TaxID=3035191 RepID=UPI0025B4C74B|nr:hypothetical protein [Planococcus sp. APC 3900]MDN3439963.1 hypothetical protein [Planococcus sp. APC 3900]
MLDKKCYTSKPRDTALLSERILHNPVELTVNELAQELVKGKAFTPAFFKENLGKIHRTKESWFSQEIIALDFDAGMTVQEAINEFATTASFIYTTFSHVNDHHKFRVVFLLDEIIYDFDYCKKLIENLVNQYPMADQKCKDPNRLFFGGKMLYEINFNNRLSVNEIAHRSNNITGPLKYIEEKKGIKNIRNVCSSEKYFRTTNIQHIKERNIEVLQRKIIVVPSKVHNNYEVLDYLKKQNLREYLGVCSTGNFNDIFHIETAPSSSIFESSKGNGHQLYKCFSTSSSFCGTIIEITERLLNCSRVEATKFLMQVYQIEVHESEQQRELKDEIDCYSELLQSDDLEEMYPNFYKVFNRYGYIYDMYILLDLVKEYVPSGIDKRLIFHHSIESISKKINKSTSATNIRMNIFAFFEFITKLQVDEIPKEIYQKQLKAKRLKKRKYYNSTYEIHIHRENFLIDLDEKCKQWIEKGCTTKTMNYEGVLRNFGREEADRVFPQDKGKVIPVLNEEVANKIRDKTLSLIEKNGWVTEQEILENVTLYFSGQKLFKQKQLKICLGELLEAYNLEKIRLNKLLKEEIGYEGKGYPNIIRKIQ